MGSRGEDGCIGREIEFGGTVQESWSFWGGGTSR